MLNVDLIYLIEKMNLENCTPEIDVCNVKITSGDINRPALQLSGFLNYFDADRIQVIGNVEKAYIDTLDVQTRRARFEDILNYRFPCLILCSNISLSEDIFELAIKHKVPILRTQEKTSPFMAEIIRWLHVELAPTISVHGVLVDVYGEGVLIMGDSGIGKSEAALELIKRGHRLISDDAIIIKKVSNETLVGYAPEILKDFIELRGIGILSVKELYGVASVKNTQQIDLVIQLVEWNKEHEDMTIGLVDKTIEFMGNKIVNYTIPMRLGRNLAVICETAAVNHRQRKNGYNTTKELFDRTIKEQVKN